MPYHHWFPTPVSLCSSLGHCHLAIPASSLFLPHETLTDTSEALAAGFDPCSQGDAGSPCGEPAVVSQRTPLLPSGPYGDLIPDIQSPPLDSEFPANPNKLSSEKVTQVMFIFSAFMILLIFGVKVSVSHAISLGKNKLSKAKPNNNNNKNNVLLICFLSNSLVLLEGDI